MRFRYASTMGERYAVPVYFAALEDAHRHQQECQLLLGGLPGQDSMQVEEWREGEWVEPVVVEGK